MWKSPDTLLQAKHGWNLNQLITFCASFIFFIQIFVSWRILPMWQFSFPLFPLKRHLKIISPATHHGEPHKRQKITHQAAGPCWLAWPCGITLPMTAGSGNPVHLLKGQAELSKGTSIILFKLQILFLKLPDGSPAQQ